MTMFFDFLFRWRKAEPREQYLRLIGQFSYRRDKLI
jgi:hypothetical protein